MSIPTPILSILSSGLVFAICLTGCVKEPPPPPPPTLSLADSPDGSAEVLRVDADSRNTIDHEMGSFLEFANEPDRVVLVDFWAPWCGPCLKMNPELESLARQFPNEVSVVKVDVDENANSALANYFAVSGIPDLHMFLNGENVGHIGGYATAREILDVVSPHIAKLQ